MVGIIRIPSYQIDVQVAAVCIFFVQSSLGRHDHGIYFGSEADFHVSVRGLEFFTDAAWKKQEEWDEYEDGVFHCIEAVIIWADPSASPVMTAAADSSSGPVSGRRVLSMKSTSSHLAMVPVSSVLVSMER